MFEFTIDKSRGLVSARVWGFWDQATAKTYAVRHLDAVRTLGLAAGEHLVLADFEEFAIQTQETVSGIQRLIDDNKARRIALVAPSALSRLQVRRLLVRSNVRVFSDLASAENWLFGDSGPEIVTTL